MKLNRMSSIVVAVFTKVVKKTIKPEQRAMRMLSKKHKRNEPVINSILQRSIK
ncbi:MAG: hypothetical protein IKF82_04105 [Bacilli bacterium]|nr:hypothetical protein [Bacilli bacterium]